ncbi:hypothetical protein GCM10010234_67010 [Streptomyces hawaiiensis]|uniref:IclR family transcriptional regulator domain-containing protein n=1 Tax=Streptomyces hawaiiensis TaxID=67305 RepID=UPI0031E2C68F
MTTPHGVPPHWRLYGAVRDFTAHRLRTDGLTALKGMAAETGESCYFEVLVGDTTLTITERVPPGGRQLGSWIGRPYPAYCSDCGQALLSDADDEVAPDTGMRGRRSALGPPLGHGPERVLNACGK